MRTRRALASALATALAAAVAAAAGAAWATYRADLARERRRVRTGSVVVHTAHGDIEYADAGRGAPVLAVHGAGGGYDQGLDIAGPLAARGYRVLAPSRFGYLRTPLPADATAEAQADAFAALLDALGVDHAAVIGASAGAPSAVQFALRHPRRCRALVLVVPVLYAPSLGHGSGIRVSPRTLRIASALLSWDGLPWLTRRFAPRALVESAFATPASLLDVASAAERRRVRTMLDHGLPLSARRAGLRNDGLVLTGLARYALEHVTAPTLVLSASDDGFRTLECARYTAAQVPRARLVEFGRGGHLLVGCYDSALATIDAFLRHREDEPDALD